jgi:O-antigen/teichoic acid export membrane protein
MASSALYQASRLGVNLLAAALLAPAAFGIWNLVVVLQTYTTHATVGLLSGANRRVPLLIGAGRRSDALVVERSALAGSVLVGSAVATFAAIAGLAAGGAWMGAAVLIGALVLSQQLYLCGQVILRGNLDFDRASIQQAALAIAFPIVGIPAVLLAGVDGLLGAQAFAYAAGFILVLWWRPDVRPALDLRLVGSVVKEGAPIMLSGLAFAVMTSVDRWALVSAGTPEQLGQYALASTISASMMFVNVVVAQQLYPRMAHAFGQHGRVDALRDLAREQAMVAGGMVAAMALVLLVVAPVVVPTLFPRYGPSVAAMQVLGIGYAVMAFASGFTNLLVTVGRAGWLLALQAFVAVIGAGLSFAALRLGLGLTGVAGAMLVSFVSLAGGAAVLVARISSQPSRSRAR